MPAAASAAKGVCLSSMAPDPETKQSPRKQLPLRTNNVSGNYPVIRKLISQPEEMNSSGNLTVIWKIRTH